MFGSNGDEAEQIALFDQIIREKAASQPPYEASPDSVEAMVKAILSKMPPPPTPDEIEAERQRKAEAAAQREQQRRQSDWASLIAARGKRYDKCTLANYQCLHDGQAEARDLIRRYCEELPANVADGSSLMLYGPPGTGKDHFLAAVMRAAVVRYGIRVRWINGMDLFGELRDRITEQRREDEWVRGMAHPQVLAISDPLPPAGDLKEHQIAMLYRAIDRRYSEGKPIWVTINVADKTEAEKRMSVQIVRRLIDNALVLFCQWPCFSRSKQ